MPRSPRLPCFPTRNLRRKNPTARLVRLSVSVYVTSPEDGEALFTKAKNLLANCTGKVSVSVHVASSSETAKKCHPLNSVTTSTEAEEQADAVIESSCPLSHHLLRITSNLASNQIAQTELSAQQSDHLRVLKDQLSSTSEQVLQLAKSVPSILAVGAQKILPQSRAVPSTERVHSSSADLSDEPKSFAELAASICEDDLPTLIINDRQKNQQLASTLCVTNPPRLSAVTSDVAFAQSLVHRLSPTTAVLEARRVPCGHGSECIEVVLDQPRAGMICAKFRNDRKSLDYPSTMLLKVKRSLLLRYAMYRMFRTIEVVQSSGSFAVQVENSWYVRFGENTPVSPYAFLYSTIPLKDSCAVSISAGL